MKENQKKKNGNKRKKLNVDDVSKVIVPLAAVLFLLITIVENAFMLSIKFILIYFLSIIIHEFWHFAVAIFVLKDKVLSFRIGSRKEKKCFFEGRLNGTKFQIKKDCYVGGGVETKSNVFKRKDIQQKHLLLFVRIGAWSNMITFIMLISLIKIYLSLTPTVSIIEYMKEKNIIGITVWYLFLCLFDLVNLIPFSIGNRNSDGKLIKRIKKGYYFKKKQKNKKNKRKSKRKMVKNTKTLMK